MPESNCKIRSSMPICGGTRRVLCAFSIAAALFVGQQLYLQPNEVAISDEADGRALLGRGKKKNVLAAIKEPVLKKIKKKNRAAKAPAPVIEEPAVVYDCAALKTQGPKHPDVAGNGKECWESLMCFHDCEAACTQPKEFCECVEEIEQKKGKGLDAAKKLFADVKKKDATEQDWGKDVKDAQQQSLALLNAVASAEDKDGRVCMPKLVDGQWDFAVAPGNDPLCAKLLEDGGEALSASGGVLCRAWLLCFLNCGGIKDNRHQCMQPETYCECLEEIEEMGNDEKTDAGRLAAAKMLFSTVKGTQLLVDDVNGGDGALALLMAVAPEMDSSERVCRAKQIGHQWDFTVQKQKKQE